MFKWIFRGLALMAALAVGFATALFAWANAKFNASLAEVEGTIEAPGLAAPATIARDAYGITHIFGESDAAVFYALGYAHAQDRFFQMDLYRRLAFGRLSELFGSRALEVDARARVRGYPAIARAAVEGMAPETRAAVEAYAAGVNARLAEGDVAPEYVLLRAEPEPWSLEDSGALPVILLDQLIQGLEPEIARARFDDVLTADQLNQFLPDYPDWGPLTLSDAEIRAAGLSEPAARPRARAPVRDQGPAPGSNAWVFGPERTQTGAPILANDPHLSLTAPSIWYLARLELADGPVIGGTIPGGPFVIMGRNAHGAWGYTNTAFDVADLLVRDREGLEVERRTETIAVRGTPAQTVVIETTPEGPILDRAYFDLEGFPEDQAVILRNAGLSIQNGGSDAAYRIMGAENWDGFVEATRGMTAPMQNMMYASVDGTIGYTTSGLLPLRREDGAWEGFVPFESLPRVSNPADGVIGTANHRIVGEAYAYPAPGVFTLWRAVRLERHLNDPAPHGVETSRAMQADTVSMPARRLLPALLSADPETALGREARARLESWDGDLRADRPEGLIYAAWMRQAAFAIYADELGEAFDPAQDTEEIERVYRDRRLFLERVLTDDEAMGVWCDDVRTEAVETCAQALGAALDAAMADTADHYGEDIDAWRWGEAHRARFEHPLSNLPVIGDWFTVRAETGGDGDTLNVADFTYRDGADDQHHGSGLRAIYDLSDLNESLFVIAPGQSGHFRSPHYEDLAALWAQNDYVQIRADWAPQDPPEGARVLQLTPGD